MGYHGGDHTNRSGRVRRRLSDGKTSLRLTSVATCAAYTCASLASRSRRPHLPQQSAKSRAVGKGPQRSECQPGRV